MPEKYELVRLFNVLRLAGAERSGQTKKKQEEGYNDGGGWLAKLSLRVACPQGVEKRSAERVFANCFC